MNTQGHSAGPTPVGIIAEGGWMCDNELIRANPLKLFAAVWAI